MSKYTLKKFPLSENQTPQMTAVVLKWSYVTNTSRS